MSQNVKVKKPNGALHVGQRTIFLAGSIEQDKAEKWQDRVIKYFENNFADRYITFYNPRRDDWNSTWKQKETGLTFNRQVNWELNHLEKADYILMYLSPGTQSPISLLELGLFAQSGKMIICSPDDFWRTGNVSIIASRFNIPFCSTLDEAIGVLHTKINMEYHE